MLHASRVEVAQPVKAGLAPDPMSHPHGTRLSENVVMKMMVGCHHVCHTLGVGVCTVIHIGVCIRTDIVACIRPRVHQCRGY